MRQNVTEYIVECLWKQIRNLRNKIFGGGGGGGDGDGGD
jgi:hypothetical protein